MKYLIIILFICLNSFGQNSSHSHVENHSHSHDNSHSHTHESINYFKSYTLEDKTYGTRTKVVLEDNFRIMTTNSLPNHKTGNFPNAGNPNVISIQNKTYRIPLYPKFTGNAKWIREPGVALNGIKFEPQTAEVVQCDTGENYRVEAIQDIFDLGLDFNHAHVQPTGAYHYHGTPTSLISLFDRGEDLVHIGFAHDGFPIYYAKNGNYKPSYQLLNGNREGEDCTYENPHQSIDVFVNGHHDGTYGNDYEYIADSGDLDECNGITINGQYLYLVTNKFPYVGRCLMGEFEEQTTPQNSRSRNHRPNFSELLAMMDRNKDNKISRREAHGPLKDLFNRVDTNNDGYITKSEFSQLPKG